jgi:hypothetical protein
MPNLGRDEIQALLQAAEKSFPHGECNTCECLLGHIAQLRIDSASASKDLSIPFKVDRVSIRLCLVCDPCPPGDLYADYMLKKQKNTHKAIASLS